MTPKELRRLSRKDLLELLIEQREALAQMQAELEETKAQLNKRRIALDKVGTMAEATLVLNGIYEATDKAAKQYLENIKRISASQTEQSAKIEAKTQAYCENLIEEAKKKAQFILAQAEAESIKKKKAADDYLLAAAQSTRELFDMHART